MADEALPEPLVPAEVDLRDFGFMPLEIERLRRSRAWLYAKRQPECGFYMLNLWAASWHEVPAASLEDDDDVLASLAMCDEKRWHKVRDIVLHGWVKCSDGRLYHPVVAEKAFDAWSKRMSSSGKGRAGAASRWGNPANKTTRSARLAAARAVGTHTAAEFQAMVNIFDGKCLKCGEEGVVRDHIKPVYQGGSDALENLQPLCRSCNAGKGAECVDYRAERLPDWRERLAERLQNDCKTPARSLRMSGKGEGDRERERESPYSPPNGASDHTPDGFSEFWQHYPRKVAKGAAGKAYRAALKKTSSDTIIEAAKRFAKRAVGKDPEFIAHAATWLNGERWADQPVEADDPNPFPRIFG